MVEAVGGDSTFCFVWQIPRIKVSGLPLLMASVCLIWEANQRIEYSYCVSSFDRCDLIYPLLPCSNFISINPPVTHHRHLRPVSGHSAEWEPWQRRPAWGSVAAERSQLANNAAPDTTTETTAGEPAGPTGLRPPARSQEENNGASGGCRVS